MEIAFLENIFYTQRKNGQVCQTADTFTLDVLFKVDVVFKIKQPCTIHKKMMFYHLLKKVMPAEQIGLRKNKKRQHVQFTSSL